MEKRPINIVLNVNSSRLQGEPFYGLHLTVEHGTTAWDLLCAYEVDPSQVGLIAVNKLSVNEEYQLRDKDTISFYPLLDGG